MSEIIVTWNQTDGMYRSLPMNDVFDAWLSSKQGEIKESSYAQYRRVVDKTLKPQFSNIPSLSIDTAMVQKIFDGLSKKYHAATVQNIVTITKQIFEYMDIHKYIKSRPNIRIKNTRKKKHPPTLTKSEQQDLVKFLLSDMDESRFGVLVSLYTGLRIGELCGLRWGDVDLENDCMYIRRTIQRISDGSGKTHFLIGSPKTYHSERDIPVPACLKPMFLAYRNSDPDVYITKGELSFTQPRTYQNRFKKYLKLCGLPSYNFHAVRHSFASRAIELGVDPKTLSSLLGHSNVRMTLDLYVHPSFEQKKRERDRFYLP